MESSLADLANMELGPNELWDKAETYFIKIVEPASLVYRLKVWCFKVEWAEDKNFLTANID